MAALGMTVRVAIDQPGDDQRRFPTHAIVVLGRPLQASAIGELALRFGRLGVNIEAIKRIADYPVTGLELSVPAPDDEAAARRPSSRSARPPGWTSRSSGSASPGGPSG